MLLEHLEVLVRPNNPVQHRQSHQEIREYICTVLEDNGRTPVLQDFPTSLVDKDGGPVRGLNIYTSAIDSRQATNLVVAHYDTVDHSPGADDNKSAVAVALELSTKCPNTAFLFPDLEEQDLLGSRHFVKSELCPQLPALVLESVGYWDEEANSQSFPEEMPLLFPEQLHSIEALGFRGNFWAILCLDRDVMRAQDMAKNLNTSTLILPVPEALLFGNDGKKLRDFGRSDHLAFWEQNRTCLMLTDTANFRNPNYHQSSDIIKTLNLDKMEQLTLDLVSYLNETKAH